MDELRVLSAAAPRKAAFLVPALLACYLVWGSTYLAIRLALASFPPFFQMGTRFLAAGMLLMGWVLWRRVDAPATAAPLPTPRECSSASWA
ncbi:MAG: yedA [Ramlibacter sp.]|jgi:drug/metabolite transporter (DMT)-like permease|nr:yedA [Ramlibacter sp.]